MKKVIMIFLALAALGVVVIYQQRITTTILNIFGMGEDRTKNVIGIASLNEVYRSVTVKRAADTIWNIAESNEQLAIKDSVSTGFDSTAMVKFNLGYLISVGERSLIVIEDPKQEAANLIEVSFDQGTFEAKSTQEALNSAEEPSTTLRIRASNTVTEVKGKTHLAMSVDKANKKAEIWIKIGEARVRDDKGTEIIIRENEKKTIDIDTMVSEPEPLKEQVSAPLIQEPEKVVPKKTKPKKTNRKLKRNDVIKAVALQRKKIDTCYERNRKAGTGKSLAIRLKIKNTGVVTDAIVLRSNLDDPTVERCVTFWMKAIRFPIFDGAAREETINFAFQ